MKMKTLLVSFSLLTAIFAEQDKVVFPKKHQVFLNEYCMDCHDVDTEKGDVSLEDLSFEITDLPTADLWQKVLGSLNSGEMPPEKKKQPSHQEKANFLDSLSKTMVLARKALSDSGGKITMGRLNRREYQNTIKALTGSKVDVSRLPTDESSDRFDTVGSSQFISSDQFEEYLKLGRAAIDKMFTRQSVSEEKSKVYRVEPEKVFNPLIDKFIHKKEETYAQFREWQKIVDEISKAPENQAIIKKIYKEFDHKRNKNFPPEYTLYQHAHKLKGAPNHKDYGFKEAWHASTTYRFILTQKDFALYKHFASLPKRESGSYLMVGKGYGRVDVGSGDLVPGNYTLRVRVAAVAGEPAHRRFIDIGHPQISTGWQFGLLPGKPIATRQVTGTIDEPQIIEIPLEIDSNTTKEFGVQEKQHNDNLKAAWGTIGEYAKKNGYGIPPAIWIDWVELEGPHSTETSSVFQMDWWVEKSSGLNEIDRARKILENFSFKAFRHRSAETDYIHGLVNLFKIRRSAGESFDLAIRKPLSVILASPGFLYLDEPSQEEERRRLDDRELAVRLAYFLWSTPPDEELMDLAKKAQLHQSGILKAQLKRMIKDPRSDHFVSGFLHQWLDMERLDFFQFDTTLYREFDDATREAARREVYESFAHLIRHDKEGQIGHLLNSNYVVINSLLASHYGIEGVTGDEYRKVMLPKGSPRGGLLGMAAIHAMGSDGAESSPVERGAWVLRHLLNDPPPPAPANVPQLSAVEGKNLTTRQKLEAHTKEPQCASCHRKIDSIGFGLENFDPIGKWREMEFAIQGGAKRKTKSKKAHAIEASGAFYKGPAFTNYFEMRELIAKREADFARGFTEHLIEYALGRPFGFTDQDLVDEILNSTRQDNYKVSSLIYTLVNSDVFSQK